MDKIFESSRHPRHIWVTRLPHSDTPSAQTGLVIFILMLLFIIFIRSGKRNVLFGIVLHFQLIDIRIFQHRIQLTAV